MLSTWFCLVQLVGLNQSFGLCVSVYILHGRDSWGRCWWSGWLWTGQLSWRRGWSAHLLLSSGRAVHPLLSDNINGYKSGHFNHLTFPTSGMSCAIFTSKKKKNCESFCNGSNHLPVNPDIIIIIKLICSWLIFLFRLSMLVVIVQKTVRGNSDFDYINYHDVKSMYVEGGGEEVQPSLPNPLFFSSWGLR